MASKKKVPPVPGKPSKTEASLMNNQNLSKSNTKTSNNQSK
jgi:hypothetical protein